VAWIGVFPGPSETKCGQSLLFRRWDLDPSFGDLGKAQEEQGSVARPGKTPSIHLLSVLRPAEPTANG
jgi:hypothetical protein